MLVTISASVNPVLRYTPVSPFSLIKLREIRVESEMCSTFWLKHCDSLSFPIPALPGSYARRGLRDRCSFTDRSVHHCVSRDHMVSNVHNLSLVTRGWDPASPLSRSGLTYV